MRIAIIGCGSAGGASALFLSRAGHQVTVFEAVEDPRPVGAGIMLQPTGMLVLSRLGLFERILGRAARIDELHCVTSGGRTLVHLHYDEIDPRFFGLGLHRGLLFESLFQAVVGDGIDMRLGCAIEGLGHDGGGRRTVVDARGEHHGPFDLVIVADGARSQLRDDTALVRRQREYRWGALWFAAKDPEHVFRRQLSQVVEGTRRMMGLLPTGLGPVSGGDDPLVSLFWSVRVDQIDDVRSGFARWREQVLRYDSRAEMVLDQIEDPDQLLFARYHDVVLSPWHTDGVVYLGDAAHAMSPQLGQGANLALWDAMVLAETIADVQPLDAALVEYSRRRRLHLGYYQLCTRWLTPFFQSDVPILGFLRDTFMGLACQLRPFRLMMTRAMCGIERGFVRRSLPLDPMRVALPPPRPGASKDT